MSKHAFLSVLGFTVVALVLGIYLSSLSEREVSSTGFPWQIENMESGHTRVFNLVIGQSTLNDAEQLYKERAKITLFSSSESDAVIEAFFSQLKIAGLKSKMVISFDLPADEIQAIYNRGARIATLDSGIRQVTLLDEDAELVRQSAIASITYLPAIHLDAELIEKRFGQPAEKIQDTESDAVHWLYPNKGVDIALSETEKEVIQYVLPKDFDDLVKPLKAVVNKD
ncbi:MAG: hypothetical protein DIZ80_01115 [endosymbiont of Galathealinum brachiosum]|uniref:Uncharacterized protein n=1 Tax=endosymbiont of Galathealinum brachiosum TaxID=2200906 RepID=A0A370DMH0_9GAMM|nr:MAG: hypothetical protein DIZ80_01115 [endosymbiont of Galathealinum brachiosum]